MTYELSFNEYPQNTKELIEYFYVVKHSIDNIDTLVNLIEDGKEEELKKYKFAHKTLYNKGFLKYLALKNICHLENCLDIGKQSLLRLLLNEALGKIVNINVKKIKLPYKFALHQINAFIEPNEREEYDPKNFYEFSIDKDFIRLFQALREDLIQRKLKLSRNTVKDMFRIGLFELQTYPKSCEVIYNYAQEMLHEILNEYSFLSLVNKLKEIKAYNETDDELYLIEIAPFKELFNLIIDILEKGKEIVSKDKVKQE